MWSDWVGFKLMKMPLQIVYRNVEPSSALEAEIRDCARTLRQFAERLTACRVTVSARQPGDGSGLLREVCVELTVGAGRFTAGADACGNGCAGLGDAVRRAFDQLMQQMPHGPQPSEQDGGERLPLGRVVERHPDYGKIRTREGQLVYFHRNSVADGDFEALEIGSEVRFVEQIGELGPQAIAVYVVGRRLV